tara:strand:- start:693 stop:1922 length:1230 start_codon:yes stop_codon:yes gene_type:complete
MTDGLVEQGRFAQNIMHFGRILRAAGLPIGPGKIIDATRAVEAAGITSRDDFYWTLHAVFVNRRDQREIFDQAFHVFWRNPQILERMMSLILPTIQNSGQAENELPSRRLLDALFPKHGDSYDQGESSEIIGDAAGTYSQQEILQSMDFESMSSDEITQAKLIISRMRLPIMQVPTRRFVSDPQGTRIDVRASLRSALRSGADTIPLKRSTRRLRHPPLVVLCDISGSMSRYSRMLLHFLHAVTNDRDRVFTFVFGTRLTNITRFLRNRDVDVALERVSGSVEDWSGGTRIGQCIKEFNTQWSRRVLGQSALVLLISDGLDRDSGEGLELEVERLHKSCQRLIWLNPLLRYKGFKPKSLGVQAILPHVDEFRTVHNLQSLKDIAQALERRMPQIEEGHMNNRFRERAPL